MAVTFRASNGVLAVSLTIAAVALLLTWRQQNERRDFSGRTTIAMGKVLGSAGARRARRSEIFCWVSYEFSPSPGATESNWRFWRPGCGVSTGRPIPIQYVVGRPDLNRPAGDEPWFPAFLLWFAAGVGIVVAVIVRRSPDL